MERWFGNQFLKNQSRKRLKTAEPSMWFGKREGGTMAKRAKLQKTDGLGPLEVKKIRTALRLVWHRSHARALVVKRCTGKDGFARCEKCGRKTPQLKIDHIQKVGDVDSGFVERLFVPSVKLQGLCKPCHDEKTKAERAAERAAKPRKRKIKDFF